MDTLKMIKKTRVLLLLIILGVATPVQSQQSWTGKLFTDRTNQEVKSFYDVSVNLQVEDATLQEIFQELEDQMGLRFLYNLEVIKSSNYRLNLIYTDTVLANVLKDISVQTGLTFRQINNTISVGVDKFRTPEVELIEEELQKTVTGRVTDAQTGEALPGVNVIVLGSEEETGSMIGVTTIMTGEFEIRVPEGLNTLIFTYIGYQRIEVDINDQIEINVELVQDVQLLDDVVVVGYGTVERQDLTGAVSSIGRRDLEETVGRTSVDEALVGKMSGVQVRFTDGEPGSSPNIRIRGIGSITAGADPLYVVDGMPVESIETINMNDVESVDILKDASAAAIYGSRGANGVVMITTRRGQEGRPIINYNTNVGFSKVSRIREMLNAEQQARYYVDGIRNANLDRGNDVTGNPSTWAIPAAQEALDVINGQNTRDVNPLDYVLRTAPMQQHSLSIRGSENNIMYSVSGEYLSQDGIIIESDYQRMSLRANFDAQVTERLNVGLNLNPAYVNRNRVSDSGHASEPEHLNIIGVATTMHNYMPILSEDGTPGGEAEYILNGNYYKHEGYGSNANLINPVAIAREIDEQVNRFRFLGNLNIDYELLDVLSLNVMLGANLNNSRDTYWRPDMPNVFYGHAGFATGEESRSWDQNWIMEYILSYNNNIGSHNISSVAGFTSQSYRVQSVDLGSNRFPNNLVQTLNAATEITSGGSTISDWSMLSYLGRVNYNFDSRYYITASIRTDGSSRFGADNRWGIFPSFGLTWRVSGERFLNNFETLTDLKLRTSYGETGNQNIGNYSHLATVSFQNYPSGAGYAPGSVPNPNLGWEKQRQWNTAVDISFFEGRLDFTMEYSRSVSSDLLLQVQVPRLTGFASALQNIGEVENVGWEFSMNSVNISTSNFSWTSGFNISTYTNEVLSLGPENAPLISGTHITAVGRPIGMFRGWIVDPERPIFLNQAEVDEGAIWDRGGPNQSRPGDYRFVDINGDGEIDAEDRVEMGSPYPDFYYGMTNRVMYRNLSLSITLNGSYGNKILAESGRSNFNTRGRMKSVIEAWNYWESPENIGDGKTPRPNHQPTGGNREQWNSSLLQDGSYLRVSNINLSYTLPLQFAQNIGLNGLRVYYNAINPFTITNFNGFNPEVDNSGTNISPGVDLNNYPIPKTHMIGIDITF